MKKDCIYSAVVRLFVFARNHSDEAISVFLLGINSITSRLPHSFGTRDDKPAALFASRTTHHARRITTVGPTRNKKIGVFQNSRCRTDNFTLFNPKRKRAGFTLVELIIATSILSIIALLIYPAYRASSRSYQLSVVQSNLQQNARIGMKKMVKELEAGMVVIPKDSNDAKEGSINYGYEKGKPYKMAFYAWDSTSEPPDNDIIALYAALPTGNTEPMDPALSLEGQEPGLYIRIRKYSSSEWSEPEPLVLSDVKVARLNFIIGGDNKDEILITLELAQKGQLKEWRTFELVSAARLGAR